MKKISYILSLALAGAFFSGCSEEEIVFDHEQPAFEIKESSILLEVIAPKETTADAELYIAGAFNGGEEAAVGNMQWQLEKSTKVDGKWGIYLDPKTFVSGKSLADGYWFVSSDGGAERSALGEVVSRTDNFEVGTRNNIYVTHWKSYFDKAPEATVHDGYTVYLEDNSGWDATALYCYGTEEACGGWPGKLPDGTENINGKTYKYFDLGADRAGMELTFIFNNNDGGAQVENFDCLKKNVINKNIFFSITAESAEAADVAETRYFYVLNNQGWDGVSLYTWGNDNEFFGGWPGTGTTGKTVTIKEKTYQQIPIPDAAVGQLVNAIFNNNGAGEQASDLNIEAIENHDYYILIEDKKAYEVNPQNPSADGEETPDPTPSEPGYSIFVQDNSGWDALYLYAYGDAEIFGGWPGKASTDVTIGGKTFKKFEIAKDYTGKVVNLIFNNNNGTQFDASKDLKIESDIYLSITSSSFEVIGKPVDYDGHVVYVEDLTSWGVTNLYGWFGSGSVTAAWPGIPVSGETTIKGYNYKYFEIPKDLNDKEINAIFNASSSQAPDFHMVLNKDWYVSITDTKVTEIDPNDRKGLTDEFSVDATAHEFEAKASNPLKVALSAKSTAWTVTSSADWAYVSDQGGNIVTSGKPSNTIVTLTLMAKPNFTTSAREATLTFKPENGTAVEVKLTQKAAGSNPFLAQWVFDGNAVSSYSNLWKQQNIIPATFGGGYITVQRGEKNASIPFKCTVKGNNPNVSTMVEGDCWLFRFPVASLAAGSVIEFDATMAGDAKSPKYYIVEYLDGGKWKCNEDELKTASENSSIKYTYKCSGDVSTGSGAADSYQYTTVLQALRFENAITSGEVQIRCRAVGDMTCDGSKQDINATSSCASSMPDFGFTACNVQNLGTSTPSKGSKKVLVLGNSFSYYFNPMFMLKEIAWTNGWDLKINAHLKGSQRFSNHLELSMSQDAIKEGGYDFAIIQDQSGNPAKYASDPTANASVKDNCVKLADEIRKYSPSCKVILVQTWAFPASNYGGYGSYDEFDSKLKEGTSAMAEAADTWIAPVGEAFKQSRADHSNWSLYYSGDSKHPTRSSAYLEACVEYVTLFGEELSSSTATCRVDATRAKYFRQNAKDLIIGKEKDYRINR